MSGYGAWRQRVFGTPYEVWHDGYDPGRFRAMTGADLEEALAEIPAGIRSGDWLAVAGARMLKMRQALPLIEDHLATARGRLAAEVARAVVALDGDADLAVASVLRALRDPNWPGRMDVAIGMRHLADDRVVEALLKQVEIDPDYLVRYHSAESLLHLGRVLPTAITRHREIFSDLVSGSETFVTDVDRARHRRAAAALRALLRR